MSGAIWLKNVRNFIKERLRSSQNFEKYFFLEKNVKKRPFTVLQIEYIGSVLSTFRKHVRRKDSNKWNVM